MKDDVGMYFKKISEKLERRANEDCGKRPFTFAQGKILCYLHEHETETVTLKDIEKFLDCSHATVSGLVSRLEEKGLVSLETNERDRRIKNLRLTEKEQNDYSEMKERQKSMEERLLSGFSEEERVQLSGYLKRIYQNL